VAREPGGPKRSKVTGVSGYGEPEDGNKVKRGVSDNETLKKDKRTSRTNSRVNRKKNLGATLSKGKKSPSEKGRGDKTSVAPASG